MLEPPPKGAIFRIVEFPPDRAPGGFDRKAAFAAMGAHHAMDPDASRHPGMHKTDTVDFALVLAGEIWALMDEGETLLRAGDTLVQRGTNHAWSNRSDQPCLVAFILVSAAPLGRQGGREAGQAGSRPRRARLAIKAPVPKDHASATSQATTSLTRRPISGEAIETTSPHLWVKPLPGAPRSATGANMVPMKSTSPSG